MRRESEKHSQPLEYVLFSGFCCENDNITNLVVLKVERE